MKTPKISDANLSMLIAARNSFGAEILYDTYGNAVMAVIIRLVPDKEAAENILVQTFVEFWVRFRGCSDKELLPLLLKITRRRCQKFSMHNVSAA